MTGAEARHPNIFLGLLAGGRAHRMGGRDKFSLALRDGQTFGATLIEAFRDSVSQVILSGRPDQKFPESCAVVHDEIEGRGPLGGLGALLAAAPCEWCFLLACDMPLVTPNVLDALAESIEPGIDAVAPDGPPGLEATCALYHRRLLSEVGSRLEKGDNALHRLLRAVRLRRVNLPGELASKLLNVNSPEELERVRTQP